MRKDKILLDLKSLNTALDDVCCSTQEIAEAISLAMSALQPLAYDEPENLSVAHRLVPQRFSYNCPNCGGAVRFIGNCEYCGTLILDKELSSAYVIR